MGKGWFREEGLSQCGHSLQPQWPGSLFLKQPALPNCLTEVDSLSRGHSLLRVLGLCSRDFLWLWPVGMTQRIRLPEGLPALPRTHRSRQQLVEQRPEAPPVTGFCQLRNPAHLCGIKNNPSGLSSSHSDPPCLSPASQAQPTQSSPPTPNLVSPHTPSCLGHCIAARRPRCNTGAPLPTTGQSM